LRAWINTFLAETWQEDTERIPASELEKRAESYRAVVPDPVLILNAGVDVQVDRLVYEVIGWGVGEESWGLEARTIPGRPDDPKTWKKLDEELQRPPKKEDGTELKVLAVGVDFGNWGDYVLKFTRTRLPRALSR
jgi:phage terminase large subunit GpA-like protein